MSRQPESVTAQQDSSDGLSRAGQFNVAQAANEYRERGVEFSRIIKHLPRLEVAV